MTGPTLLAPSAGEPSPFEGVLGIGDVIAGKYVVEKVLGAGGMGIVVGARHMKLDEQVAIKCLLPSVANDKESVERFMREARASVKIKNEHVVRVMDVGLLDTGSPYMLMEHLEGNDLGHHLREEGRLPIADAVDYVLQACEAIAEAHALGIVHRDLKPSNLFLMRRSDGTPCIKVLDFGISKALSVTETPQDPGLTDTQSVFGSPTYMSPEQVRSAKRVDHRTDIWALGVILHELITGTSPFVGESVPGLLASIVADPPTRARSTRAEVPEGLELVIMGCLEKDVNRRTQTIADLARALFPYTDSGSASSVQRIERLSIPRAPGSRPSVHSVRPPTG
ncbi:MAG: serine/threonine protein kinase, partial [Myxococcaceae bacterium]|nr:serine/threonine protein kinase [Myxococcaceae bacterium]